MISPFFAPPAKTFCFQLNFQYEDLAVVVMSAAVLASLLTLFAPALVTKKQRNQQLFLSEELRAD
jgi:hypothetical protein